MSEWLGYYVKVWIIEWASEFLGEGMSGRVSQWVSDEMREQSSEEADVWNYESEWENEEVCELMSEDLNQYVSEKVNNLIEWLIELRCVEMRWGDVSEWEGESERASDFDVWSPKMTTSSMLGRHWTECLLHSLTD